MSENEREPQPDLQPWFLTDVSAVERDYRSGATVTLTLAPPTGDPSALEVQEHARVRAFEPLSQSVRDQYLRSPAHRHYSNLRDKLADTERDLAKLTNQLSRIGVDRSDLMLGSLSGEKLAVKLGKLDAQERDLKQRLQDAARGKEILEDSAKWARLTAEEALESLLSQAVVTRDKELHQKVQEAKAAFGEMFHERLGVAATDLATWIETIVQLGVGAWQRKAVEGFLDEAAIEPEPEPEPEPAAEVEPESVAEPAEAEAAAV